MLAIGHDALHSENSVVGSAVSCRSPSWLHVRAAAVIKRGLPSGACISHPATLAWRLLTRIPGRAAQSCCARWGDPERTVMQSSPQSCVPGAFAEVSCSCLVTPAHGQSWAPGGRGPSGAGSIRLSSSASCHAPLQHFSGNPCYSYLQTSAPMPAPETTAGLPGRLPQDVCLDCTCKKPTLISDGISPTCLRSLSKVVRSKPDKYMLVYSRSNNILEIVLVVFGKRRCTEKNCTERKAWGQEKQGRDSSRCSAIRCQPFAKSG